MSEPAVTGTPVTTVTVGVSGESVVPALPKMSYEVSGIRGYLVVYVGRPSNDEAEVAVFLGKPVYLPVNVSRIMVRVDSNARGVRGITQVELRVRDHEVLRRAAVRAEVILH